MGFARLDPGKPTIAAVNGHCYGGALELSLWCDFRIAAQNAQFGALNRQWGVTLIDGGTQRLPRIVGYGNAMWMIQTGSRIDAQRALEIGLCQELVPVGQALSRALEIAHALAELPQPALVADRRGVGASMSNGLKHGLDFETKVGRAVLGDPEVVARSSPNIATDGAEPDRYRHQRNDTVPLGGRVPLTRELGRSARCRALGALIQQNIELTTAVHRLAAELHAHMVERDPPSP